MIRRLLEAIKLIKPPKPHLPQANVSGSAFAKVNPYTLVWYRADWSKTKTEKNNAKYWEWEIMHNGFKCP
jgi:hypothetical protein